MGGIRFLWDDFTMALTLTPCPCIIGLEQDKGFRHWRRDKGENYEQDLTFRR